MPERSDQIIHITNAETSVRTPLMNFIGRCAVDINWRNRHDSMECPFNRKYRAYLLSLLQSPPQRRNLPRTCDDKPKE